MGHELWKRHFIVNVQPGDSAIDKAVEHLQRKPLREQGKERLAVELRRLVEHDPDGEDKVYLVGHGGTSTLGGMDPVELALKVRGSLKQVSQINLVMCGDHGSTLNCAESFAHQLREAGYDGDVFAYVAPLTIAENGKKFAVRELDRLDLEAFETIGMELPDRSAESSQEVALPARNRRRAVGDE